MSITENGAVDAIERAEHDVLAGSGVDIRIRYHFIETTIERVDFAAWLHLSFFRDRTLMVAILTQRCISRTEDRGIIYHPVALLKFLFNVVRALAFIIRSHSEEDLDVFFLGFNKCWLAAGGEGLN